MDIFEKINNLATEIQLLRQKLETLQTDHKKIAHTMDHIKKTVDDYGRRFEKIDNLSEYKGSWLKGFERNWWKIAIVVTPVCIGIFELGIWLKNLPVPPIL